METVNIRDQIIASIVRGINDVRIEDYRETVQKILTNENNQLTKQTSNLLDALNEMEQVRKFVDSGNLEHVLGSMRTKHGEIAEHLEVGITNAFQSLKGLDKIANIDTEIVGRTVNAPADYIVDGLQVQSKFINSELNTLKHVFEHLQKYEDIGFARGDGSYYHIPKDQFENIMKAFSDGEIPGRSIASAEAVVRAIKKIEEESGQKFTDIVKAANANYSDVQLGKINDTINNYKEEISKTNDEIVKNIKKDTTEKIKAAADEHKPNLGEAGKAGLTGAVVGGGLKLAIKIYQKKKTGKKIGEFTVDDWKEIGVDTAEGAIQGGITGISIYGLTNYAHMSASIAGGFVTASFGVAKSLYAYKNGKITFEEFKDNSETICLESSFVALGTLVGQTVIPIPVLGAVVGSVTSSVVMDVYKNIFAEEKQLFDEYFKQVQEERAMYKEEVNKYVDEIIKKYNGISDEIQNAFNEDLKEIVRFANSSQLALSCGVPPNEVLTTKGDVDVYFS